MSKYLDCILTEEDFVITCDGVMGKKPLYGVQLNQRFSTYQEAIKLRDALIELSKTIAEGKQRYE